MIGFNFEVPTSLEIVAKFAKSLEIKDSDSPQKQVALVGGRIALAVATPFLALSETLFHLFSIAGDVIVMPFKAKDLTPDMLDHLKKAATSFMIFHYATYLIGAILIIKPSLLSELIKNSAEPVEVK